MKTVPSLKPRKTRMLRARCEEEIKSLVERSAYRLGVDEADVIRLAIKEFAGRILFQPPALHATR